VAAADAILEAVKIPTVAPSLGTTETLITLPVRTSHAGMRPEDRERIGITDDLIRVSAGIESTKDLLADFAQALERAAKSSREPARSA
jgi:cystathionine beta-lyase/cystathionine gamma-synthase